MTLQITLLLVLIVFSGLFASSEIVFIVANKAKMEVRARRKKFGAARALSFVSTPEEYLHDGSRRQQYRECRFFFNCGNSSAGTFSFFRYGHHDSCRIRDLGFW